MTPLILDQRRHSPIHQTPVIVLSGFLGGGKTTLLNSWLRQPAFADTAVIVNELGQIGLDQLLIEGVANDVVLLSGGCLCCGLGSGLRETLLDLDARRRAGDLPPFKRVVVETSGLADPAPILQALLRDKLISDAFVFDQLITVVDALHWARTLADQPEARPQIALADRLAVSKLDLAPDGAMTTVARGLRALNPLAPIIDGRDAGGLVAAIAEPEHIRRRGVYRVEADPVAERHRSDVAAHAFVINGAIGWSGVAAWIDLISDLFEGKLLRCKGLLAVRGAAGPVLIQGVRSLFAPPKVLPAWPDADERARLVCIVRDLDPALLRASLPVLYTEPGAFRPASITDMLAEAGSADGSLFYAV